MVSCQGLFHTDLSIEVVSQVVLKLALYGVLLSKQGQVMAQLFMGGDDGALTILVKLGTTGTPKNLHNIQDAQIHQSTTLGIINLSALLTQR